MTANTWAIGDVQGCTPALQQLLQHPLLAQPASKFWFVGDLVNRGPDSLGALRLIKGLGQRARVVLGNHDLHLLAVAAGVRKIHKSDTFQDVLQAADADELITWLRQQPLFVRAHDYVMVHAGILPAWDLAQAQALAHEIEAALRGPNWRQAVDDFYGESPVAWDDSLQGAARMRVIVNALTRMRMCDSKTGAMQLKHKAGVFDAPGLSPWFAMDGRRDRKVKVLFGHWSALGLNLTPDAICLDSGCVWGRKLSALRLADLQVVQQDCLIGQT